MRSETLYQDYGFPDANASHMHRHFMPKIFELVAELEPGTRVLDVGCGNGFMCREFLKKDCRVVGLDLSEQGIHLARKAYPDARFEILAADEHVLERLDEKPFDLVVSTEVVEHLYAPRLYARGCFAALRPGGRFICTTPYHGYLKNLALSIMGRWDKHADPMWDGGHIKLWSRAKLSALLLESGFENIQFTGAGRIPWLWMTMVMSAYRPSTL